jgi:hypothetical protein
MTGSAYWELGFVSVMMVSHVYNHHRVDSRRTAYLPEYVQYGGIRKKNKRMKKRISYHTNHYYG